MEKDTEKIKEESQAITEQLRGHLPQLRRILDLDIKLKGYPAVLHDFELPQVHSKRQELIRRKLTQKLEKLFGDNAIKELNINLNDKLAFNIADHHQILNHPFLLSSNVVSSTDKFLQKTKQEAIIVISSGDVPPSNYFSKNGFTFHDQRIPIFSNSEKESTSYYLPKRDFDFIEKLKAADRWKEFSQEEKDFLSKECDKIRSYDYSSCQNYNDQVSIIVKNLWPSLFEEKLRKNLPELIYITQEELVTDCLIELLEEENIISKCLFDPRFREGVLNNFRGIVVTWKEKEEKGTHFFWRKYPDRNESLRLYEKDGKLVPKDERFKDLSVPLEKDVIIDLLKKREIYPSLFMIFGVLNFYAGVKPLVGYGSVVYLDLMKQAWIKTLNNFNLGEEAKLVDTVDTDGLVAGLALFFKKNENALKTLYAYDIIYEGGITSQYLEKVFDMSFSDFISVSVVDFYDYFSQKYIPKEEHIKTSINFDDLATLKFNWL